MTPEDTICQLLALAGMPEIEDPGALPRKAARVAWARGIRQRLAAAQKRVDEAWERIFEQSLPPSAGDCDSPRTSIRGERGEGAAQDGDVEGEPEAIPDPPEQAALDALHAEISDVIERDRWPRELYFGGI